MPAETKVQPQVEIGHVLFIDVVGYSKLLINEQHEIQHQLNEVVRSTDQFRAAESENKLTKLPTGDGMALVFANNVEAPVQCALEIGRALRRYPQLKLRMGIHSGPVSTTTDVNERTNVAGAGINIAQRVMDCADAGHILLSKRAAEDLASAPQWQPCLHDLGEVEVKHGIKVPIVNLFAADFGNAALPEKVKQARREQRVAALRRRKRLLTAAAILIVLGGAMTALVLSRERARKAAGALLEKSIAVLPFEDFSGNKEDNYFADGVQDDILTNLAKIADLKVIGRTSVLKFRGSTLSSREIGQALGVAYLLEGSVRKLSGRLRVNAQLIDTRTDAHVWAEDYDRALADIFTIESELTQRIVSQLKAKLAASEKSAVEKVPTKDLEAYDLYLRAKEKLADLEHAVEPAETLDSAQALLETAVSRDPKFALAYAFLTEVHLDFYWWNFDRSPDRAAQAEQALKNTLRTAPDLGEAHIAEALFYRVVHHDYERGRQALAIAAKTLPNNSQILRLSSTDNLRHGKPQEAVRDMEKAVELDPRNDDGLIGAIEMYQQLKRYSDADKAADRAMAVPESADRARFAKAAIAFGRGDTHGCRSLLDALPKGYDAGNGYVTAFRIYIPFFERNYAEAMRALAASSREWFSIPWVDRAPRAFVEAIIARAENENDKAREGFRTARGIVEIQQREQPDNPQVIALLGIIDAGLGHNEEALREGRKAVEMRPVSDDEFFGGEVKSALALIYAWTGQRDLAIQELTELSKLPLVYLTGGEVKLDPVWDTLRNDPRFQQLVATWPGG
jgi:TolB-like protein